MRLIDADKIIFREIDEIGGEYDPFLGCSKDQIYSLPPVEAITKDQYEVRLNADLLAMLTKIQTEIEKVPKYRLIPNTSIYVYREAEEYRAEITNVIQQKIDALKAGSKNT
jgi:hypothetical protein